MHTISVVLDDSLYTRLKQTVPNRKVSKFVSNAIADKLQNREASLYSAYKDAYADINRKKELDMWDRIDGENWD
jgi:hypothetical protein